MPPAYKEWHTVLTSASGAVSGPGAGSAAACGLQLRLQPAGHILGSAYAELDATWAAADGQAQRQRVVFSGDLGAPYTRLRPAPQPPASADLVVMESTCGDDLHEGRKTRRQRLQALCEHAFGNGGVLLVPAFSIGRTQELLYELEETIHRNRARPAAAGVAWGDVQVVVDSPLAADFTAGYGQLKALWDAEARAKLAAGHHPLDFAQLTAVDEHAAHLRMVAALARSARPAIVIAASGTCSGGRIVNYSKAMLGDARHDVLFCG